MQKCKCKSSSRFLIKDEWYEIADIDDFRPEGWENQVLFVSYQLVNHTKIKWSTNWYNITNFYTLEELRDMNLDLILKK